MNSYPVIRARLVKFLMQRSAEQRGVGFLSLTANIETNNAAGKLIFHVFASLAEFERN